MLARIISPLLFGTIISVGTGAAAQPAQPAGQGAQAPATPAPVPPTPAAEDETATPSAAVEYSRRLQAIENSTGLDEKQKAKAIDAYKLAISLAEVEASLKKQTADFQSQLKGLPNKLATARSEVESLPPPQKPANDATLDALNSEVRLKSAAVEQLRQDLAGIDADIAMRDKRLLDIPTEIADASQRMSTVDNERSSASPDADPMVKAAVTAAIDQRRLAIQAELDSLKSENTWRVSQGELLRQRREKTRRELDSMQVELSNWQAAAQDKRETEVDRDLRLAREQLTNVSSSLGPVAQENVELAKRRLAVQGELQLAMAEQEKVTSLVKKLEQSFERSQQEVEAGAGLSQSLGEVLREKRLELRRLSQKLKSATSETTRVSEARLKLYVLRNQEAELDELSEAVSTLAADLGLSSKELPALEELLRFQQSLVSGLRTDTEALFQVLAKLAGSGARLRSVADQFTTFIDEHVLWVRSTEMFGPQQVTDTVTTVRGALEPSRWKRLGGDIVSNFRKRPLLPLLLVGLAAFILTYHSRMRRDLKELSRRASSGNCRDFMLTLRAALLTMGIAVGWPAIVLLTGSWLNNGPNSVEVRSLATGLVAAGGVALLLETWRQVARPEGMMESHFNAPARAAQLMYSNLRWFSPTLSVSVGLTVAVLASGNPQSDQSFGRVALIVAMLAIAVFVYRVGHPARGAVQAFFAYRTNDVLFKWRHILFAIALGTPIALAILAFVGYQYTAAQLAHRMLWTIATLFTLWFVQSLVLRWVVLSRRRLAIEQARARMAINSDSTDQDPHPELEEIDLTSVDMQTRRLVRAVTFIVGLFALWTLWMDALPALSRFDELKAWDVSVPAATAATSADAAVGDDAVSGSTVRMVSYADVGKAIAIVIAMVLAMRDLPGLLELVLLQRLPLDNALRFAISTLTRYLIFMIGAISALGAIEIGWSQVQWLVAGVSVGLGFGLQEIFANFVSGLIILFERPLRAGDIVTIDGVTGIVKRVRMRSTIIQDWDRKDLVVPNRDFITGRLLNWTLSDEVSRIVLPVGVAYGSDTDLAKEIVRSVATEHPLIIDEPAPLVTFESFGDSSLDIVLRCFISLQNMASRLQIIDDLHTRIDRRFREAGVEIPFPQRDVHFRSTLPIESDAGKEPPRLGADDSPAMGD